MKKRFFLTIILSCVLFLPVVTKAYSVSPAKIFLTVDENSANNIDIKIKNTEDNSFFVLSVLGIKQDDLGRPTFGKNWDDAEGWISPKVDKVFIKKDEEKTVSFSINIPKNVFPGAHYIGLIAQPENTKKNQVGLRGALASVLSIQVAGTAREDLSILEWKGIKTTTSDLVWFFSLKLKSDSNIDIPLKGQITVKNFLGKKLQKDELHLGNNLFANTQRNLKPEVLLREGIFWPGFYEVEIAILYGRTGQILRTSTNILYLPNWSLIAGGIILILFIIFGRFLFLKIKRKTK